jgi:hypothetical protein
MFSWIYCSGWIAGIVFLTWLFTCFSKRELFRPTIGWALLGTTAFVIFFTWNWWGYDGAGQIVDKWIGKSQVSSKEESSKKQETATSEEAKEKAERAAARLTAAGQAGDLFGGFNALFSSLAFVAAGTALVLQAKTMRATQQQVALQAFEPMFLHLTLTHERLATSTVVNLDGYEVSGVAQAGEVSVYVAAAKLSEAIRGNREFREIMPSSSPTNEKIEFLTDEYLTIYRLPGNEFAFGPYFRSLYHIFKFIKNSNLTLEQKASYANIARSTLGVEHLFLLSINCLTKYGEGFKPLVEEYGLLKHMAEHEPESKEKDLGWQIVKWGYSETARLSANEREIYWQQHPNKRPSTSPI